MPYPTRVSSTPTGTKSGCMSSIAALLITLGATLLPGLLTTALAKRAPLTRVALLLAFGVLVGPQAFNLFPAFLLARFELIADVTLLMAGFLLGSRLTWAELANEAHEGLGISLAAVAGTALVAWGSLMAVGMQPSTAIVLGRSANGSAGCNPGSWPPTRPSPQVQRATALHHRPRRHLGGDAVRAWARGCCVTHRLE